jgi:hypothetical protein
MKIHQLSGNSDSTVGDYDWQYIGLIINELTNCTIYT